MPNKYTMNVPLRSSQEIIETREKLQSRWEELNRHCCGRTCFPPEEALSCGGCHSTSGRETSLQHFEPVPRFPLHLLLQIRLQWPLIHPPILRLRRIVCCLVPLSLSFLASSYALFPPLASPRGPLSRFVPALRVPMAPSDPSSRLVSMSPLVRPRRPRLSISSHCAIVLRYTHNFIVKNLLTSRFYPILKWTVSWVKWVLPICSFWVGRNVSLFGQLEVIFRFFRCWYRTGICLCVEVILK